MNRNAIDAFLARTPAAFLVGMFMLPFSSEAALADGVAPGDIVITADIGTYNPNGPNDFAVIRVDPMTGDRTIISDNTHGTGPAFVQAEGITLLPNGHLLVGDSFAAGGGQLLSVDPVTGDRTIVSGPSVGSGPSFDAPIGGRLIGNQIIVPNLENGTLTGVDPTTGNRTIISNSSVGSGPALNFPVGVVPFQNGSVLVANNNAGQILQVDLTTGNRSIFSGSGGGGTGPSLLSPVDIEYDNAGSLLVSAGLPGIYRIDPLTGNRTIVTSNSVGTGPTLTAGDVNGIAIEASGMILLNEQNLNAVLTVDPLTGNRVIFSDATHGAGPAFSVPLGILVVPEPSTFVLAVLGGLALLLITPRRVPSPTHHRLFQIRRDVPNDAPPDILAGRQARSATRVRGRTGVSQERIDGWYNRENGPRTSHAPLFPIQHHVAIARDGACGDMARL